MPLFGNPAVMSFDVTRGFASQPRDWFAFIGEGRDSSLFRVAGKAMRVPE
jgi:hypothetical protein